MTNVQTITDKDRAKEMLRLERVAESDLTARQLAEHFGKSDRWARNVRAEVLAEEEQDAEATEPNTVKVPSDPVPTLARAEQAEMPEPSTETTRSQGRGVAWASFLLALAASLGANILHSVSAAPANPSAWIFAAFWPFAVLLTVELMTRVDWKAGKGWNVVRYAGTLGVLSVAAIASYEHMHSLLLGWGETSLIATIGPLGVDGLLTIAALALLSISDRDA